jgi:hypothetical protein
MVESWGGQFCPPTSFQLVEPPEKAAAATIGRPTIEAFRYHRD